MQPGAARMELFIYSALILLPMAAGAFFLSKKYLTKIIEISILSMIILIPVIFYTRTNDVFETNKIFILRFFTIVAFALWVIKTVKEGLVVKRTVFDFPMIGFLLISALTTVFTKNFEVSVFGVYEDFEGIITILNYFILYYVIVNYANSMAMVYKIIIGIIIATFFTAMYGLAQNSGYDFVVWNPETYSPERFFATLGNPNFLAAYIVEAVPILFVLFFIAHKAKPVPAMAAVFFSVMTLASVLLVMILEKKVGNTAAVAAGLAAFSAIGWGVYSYLKLKKTPDPQAAGKSARLEILFQKLAILFILGASIVVLFLTKSRAGFISFLATVFIIIVYTVYDARKKESELFKRNIPWFIGFGVVMLAMLAVPKVQEAFAHLFWRIGLLFSNVGLTPRLYIWLSSLMMFRDFPVLGTGIDTFQVMFPYYRLPIYWQLEWNGTPEKTHNVFLQVLSTQGIAGFSMYLLLLYAFFRKTLSVISSEKEETRRYLAFAFLMAVIAYFIQGMFNYTVVAYGLIFWLALAIIIILDTSHQRLRSVAAPAGLNSWLFRNRFLVAIPAVFLCFTLAASLSRYWTADIHYKVGNILTSRPELDAKRKAIEYYAKSVELNPYREIYWVKYGIAYEQVMRSSPDAQERYNSMLQAERVHQRTVSMNRMNGYNFNNLARVYKFWGEAFEPAKYADAIKNYEMAIERDVNNAYFAIDMASTMINMNNLEGAFSICERFSRVYPDFAVPLSYLGYIRMLQGNTAESRKYYEEAIKEEKLPDGTQKKKNWYKDVVSQLSTYSNLAVIYINAGEAEAAARMFEKSAEVKPDYREGWLNLAKVRTMQNRHRDALRAYGRVLQLDPNDERALKPYRELLAAGAGGEEEYTVLGEVYANSAKKNEAVAAFQRALAMNPSYVRAMSGLGQALFEEKKFSEAAALYSRAYALEPKNTDVLVGYAFSLKASGAKEDALRIYNEAITAAPENLDALEGLGILYYELYRYKEARRIFERVKQINPESKNAAWFLEYIRKAGG
jgi:tetratricopeptide (TPR) repeat protein